MFIVTIRVYGDLNDFLPVSRRQASFEREIRRPTSIKDLIESAGIPHTEIDALLLDEQPAEFDRLVDEPCRIAAYPRFTELPFMSGGGLLPPLPNPPQFILDVHLGKLARYLRILGFDARYANSLDDDELVQISVDDDRILLTRDRQLLMRRALSLGYYVRETNPRAQVTEIIQRLRLTGQMLPFSRCPACNRQLRPVAKPEIESRLEPLTSRYFDEFWICEGCERIYWEGSHHARLREIVNAARD
ncbi:MAG: Mut7-C RNAse domain-containing protein [Thermomicrobiales bacterium]